MFENFPKPMQLVVTAVVAFGGAAVIKLVLVYFFRLISIFKFVLHTMEKELFDIFTDA